MAELERIQDLIEQLTLMGKGMNALYHCHLVPDKPIDRIWDVVWFEPVYEALDRHHISHDWDDPEHYLINLEQALFESRG